MPDLQRLETALRNADAAGDTAAAQTLASEIRKQRTQVTPVPVAPGARIPAAPSQNITGTATPRLGPDLSGVVRPVVEGLGGIATAIPDFATNLVNLVPESVLGPKVQSPGDWLQQQLDRYTTAPTTRGGKVQEFINSSLVGGAAGPRMPRVPSAGPIAQRLAWEGVTTTPGQRAAENPGQVSQIGRFLEEKLSNVHPSVRAARASAVEDWRTARLNESLRGAGAAEVPRGTSGRDALRYTYEQLQQRYDTALSKMRGELNSAPGGSKLPVPKGQPYAPGSLRDRLEGVRTLGQSLDEPQRRTLTDILDRQIIRKFTAAGRASGQTIKEIEETLRTEIEHHEGGGYQDRLLANALRQARAELDTMLQRVNPRSYAEKQAVDRGYAQYKLSEKASTIAPTQEGRYTPGQRLSAAKARDTSKDRGRFARGQARGQQEAEETQRVLGNIEPNSGTPAGMALLTGLSGIGGTLTGTGHAAEGIPALMAALGPMAIYNPTVLRWLQRRATQSGPEAFSSLGAAGGAQQVGSVDQLGVAQ